jgi:hypothetical protein
MGNVMDVVIDGESNFHFDGEPHDVLAAVGAINDFLAAKGRMLVGIRADGRDIAPDQLVEDFGDKPLSEVGRLEATTATVESLVTQSLADLEKVLPNLPEACHRLAALFHGETPDQGYEPFLQLVDIWGQIKERQLQVARAASIDLDDIEIEGRTLTQIHEELNTFLKEAAQALEVRDCVLLGDLLEYELAPRAEQEAAIVAVLRTQAKG